MPALNGGLNLVENTLGVISQNTLKTTHAQRQLRQRLPSEVG